MCGLYGFLFHGEEKDRPKSLSKLARLLGEESSVRGTDATGIAYVDKSGYIRVNKAPKSSLRYAPFIPNTANLCMGHTRNTTQGNAKVNANNHPFMGGSGESEFALAHNGVLHNEQSVRATEGLDEPKIETDTYVAVQVLQKYGMITKDSLKHLGETVEGMFAFTVVDRQGNLHIVRNDSPFSLLYFPNLKLYTYASTDNILLGALSDYKPTEREYRKGNFEEIIVKEGDILTIDAKGSITWDAFTPMEEVWYSSYYNNLRNIANGGSSKSTKTYTWGTDTVEDYYTEYLYREAEKQGVSKEIVEYLIDMYGSDTVEESLYDDTLFDLVSECFDIYSEDEILSKSTFLDEEESYLAAEACVEVLDTPQSSNELTVYQNLLATRALVHGVTHNDFIKLTESYTDVELREAIEQGYIHYLE